jgi:hypothetical protein
MNWTNTSQKKYRPGMLASACNPSYLGGRDWEDRLPSHAKPSEFILWWGNWSAGKRVALSIITGLSSWLHSSSHAYLISPLSSAFPLAFQKFTLPFPLISGSCFLDQSSNVTIHSIVSASLRFWLTKVVCYFMHH